MRNRRGNVILTALFVAIFLFFLLLAVLSFYIEAIAVSAKKDEHSQRLRRFSHGLEKIEQVISRARVVDVRARQVTVHILDEALPDTHGFPNYSVSPAQLVSTEKGVYFTHELEQRTLLMTEKDEHITFKLLTEQPELTPPGEPQGHLLSVALYAAGEGRNVEFFHRTFHLIRY